MEIVNGYDTALQIVAEKKLSFELIKLAEDFLKFQEESEELTGDNDNPFNSDVHNYIEEEEKFLIAVYGNKYKDGLLYETEQTIN